ncbi:ankyrin repeat domain-containing protein [Caminicella sporogenes]|uniref:ankyrin repeat domain-containing protein n=1 Tax=Caminicella sporogenes TaxID=166485 RepID=UPI0025417563|nr:ankyrin repeat domain-containing protein [Caminicella sporogenes]WIF95080.1 ankyrin repeat domain-containing protein [Caminicella sporogenes]
MIKRRLKFFMIFSLISAIIVSILIFSSKSTTKQVEITENKDKNFVLNFANKQNDKKVHYTIDELTKRILENDIDLVRAIVMSKSVDINQKDSKGKYPLEIVFIMNNCDMAKILLEAGADPYIIISNGETIYDKAMKSDSEYLKKIFKNYCK